MKKHEHEAFNEMTPFQYFVSIQQYDAVTGKKKEAIQVYAGFQHSLNLDQSNSLAALGIAMVTEGHMLDDYEDGDSVAVDMDAIFDEDDYYQYPSYDRRRKH